MKIKEKAYHIPVMLAESLEGLAINPNGIYVDVTFGGGGHSKAIFKNLQNGRLISFDQDIDAKINTWSADNFHFVHDNFSQITNNLKLLGISKVDGIIADLGVSSYQFDKPERGFSIRSNQPLDMRMNALNPKSALHVVNEFSEEQLAQILRNYAELRDANRIAQKICFERQKASIDTTGKLVSVLQEIAPRRKENQFLAQVFQAIRIEVNDELSALRFLLEQADELLVSGGRIVILSYHSLEDRLVKNYFKKGSFSGQIKKDFFGNVLKPFTEINRKPLIPSESEIILNPRSRSAKLRIASRNVR